MLFEVQSSYIDDPSFEGGEEGEEPPKVLDVVSSLELVERSFEKEEFMPAVKQFIANTLHHLSGTNPDRIGSFKSNVNVFFKGVIDNFENYTFYTGPSFKPDGSIVMSVYRGGEAPVFLFLKDALIAE